MHPSCGPLTKLVTLVGFVHTEGRTLSIDAHPALFAPERPLVLGVAGAVL